MLRVQPIANNGRDFVDEWLQSPWAEAQQWTSPAKLDQLKPTHENIASLQIADSKEPPELTYGPVRSCSDSHSHFQVGLILDWTTAQKPIRQDRLYFQIQQGYNSFTMLSSSNSPDLKCTGPDITVKR
jgi:hypothetical protein